MGATDIYALPYQEVGDAPNGPTLGQNLAEAVEAALLGIVPLSAVKSADQTIDNSTTLANCTDMAISLPTANKRYTFITRAQYRANASTASPAGPDIKMGWTFPSGLTMAYTAMGQSTGGSFAQFNNTQSTTLALGGFNADLGVLMIGELLVGSTTGTLQLQFAQNVQKSGNGVIIRAASSILLLPM